MSATIGCDPEFFLLKDGQPISTRKVLPPYLPNLPRSMKIHEERCLVELHPEYSTNPREVVRNLRSLFDEFFSWVKLSPRTFSLAAGSYVTGLCSTGGHIHIGGVAALCRREASHVHRVCFGLSALLGLEDEKQGRLRRARRGYGHIYDWRDGNEGKTLELRSLCSEWTSHPNLAVFTLNFAKRLAEGYNALPQPPGRRDRRMDRIDHVYGLDPSLLLFYHKHTSPTYIFSKSKDYVSPLVSQEWWEEFDYWKAWLQEHRNSNRLIPIDRKAYHAFT